MAIAIESQGQFAELLGILKKRRWQIILPICFGLALGAAVAVVAPKKYLIKTTVELRDSRVSRDANSRTTNTPSIGREITGAENHIIHYGRIKGVIEEQAWDEYVLLSAIEKQEFVEGVMDNLEVVVKAKRQDTGSTFMDIEYLATDPDRGEAFLKKLSHVWVEEVVDRERRQLQDEVDSLRDRSRTAEKDWRDASSAAKDLVKSGRLSPAEIDADREAGIEDPDFTRLVTLEDRMADMQGEVAGLDKAIAKLDEAIAGAHLMVPVNLKTKALDRTEQIAGKQLELAGLRKKQDAVTSRNPDYHKFAEAILAAEEQIALLENSERTAEIIQDEVVNDDRVKMAEQREALQIQREQAIGVAEALDEAIDGATTIVAEKSDLKEQYYLAEEERDRLKEEHTLVSAQFQAKLRQLALLDGVPYEFVKEALAPERPSEPQPAIIISIGLLIGLALGAGSAILSEFAKDGFRTAAELSRSMSLPILGVVDVIQTRGQRRARALRRTIVGLASAIVIAGLLVFVWAYVQRPELLPVELLEQLDAIRGQLR